MCWPNPSHASEDTKCISTCVDQTPPLVARTQSASQHMLTEFSPCQRGQKMNLAMWWPNLSHASEDKKCISLYLTNPIQASEVTKCISTSIEQNPSYQRGQKMHLYMCWPNPSHASEDTKCIATCVDKTPPLPVRKTNLSQHVLTKPIPWQRECKMHPNMCWPNPSHTSKDTKFISTCGHQNLPCQQGNKYISTWDKHNYLMACLRRHKKNLNWADHTPPMTARN